MLLSLDRITKSFDPTTVLDGVSLVLNDGDRVALVGANGSGKSTLLRILTGEVEPDGGTVRIAGGVELGYLPQEPPEVGASSLADLLAESVGGLRTLERRLRELEGVMTTATGPDLEAATAEYGDVMERFKRRGGYELEHRTEEVLAGLGLAHLPRARIFATLSGGEKTRVLLAGLLLRAPDVLLLDEPTNHLDRASTTWLEGYLGRYRGAFLVVSHDRRFVNAVATLIVELDEYTRTLASYSGNYDAYRAAKLAEQAHIEREFERQQEEIKALRRAIKTTGRQVSHARPPTDNDKFARNFFREQVDRAVSRNVRNAEERLRRIEEDQAQKPARALRINPDFDPSTFRSAVAIGLEGVTVRLGGRVLLDDVSLVVGPRDRVVIVGENGVGKSTLLNLIAGRLKPDAGTVRVASAARLGYLDQDGRDLDPDATLLDAYRRGLPGSDEEVANGLFRHGFFRRDDLARLVGRLSLGQRRKLQVARLVAERANLLLLDEPTNHLSFDVLEALEEALRQFPGPIVAVSHDRWFIERFGGQVLELRDGHLHPVEVAATGGA